MQRVWLDILDKVRQAAPMNEGLILKLSCADKPGLVAKIATYASEFQANLVELNQFTDRERGRFFARLEVDTSNLQVSVEDFIAGFEVLGKSVEADWHFRRLPYKMRTAVLVTKTDHCLNEILWRTQLGELPIEITSVIGNRKDCEKIAQNAGIPFHHIEMKESKEAGFRQIERLLEEQDVQLVVLARFMQIMPDWLCKKYSNRMINIHHSFLPAFIGANPYRQAYERGVKLIGATCHYVTSELDAGPIIDQEVERVMHHHAVNDLVRLGRDCERSALARGIRYHVHDRTIIDEQRAIVFPD
ncbi:formyltetrahydrofolate deformylase [Akkermansiaceae bacterium]|nr:formyltetrahydrofolate deformylase [Akkermansiaceae bacterium]